MTAVVIIEAVVILLLVVLVAGLLKSHAEILRKLDRLGTGETVTSEPRRRATGLGRAPSDQLTGVDPTGAAVSLSLRPGTEDGTLLAFLTTGCASCRVFWEELANEPDMPSPGTRPIVVTKGVEAESPSKVRELAPRGMTVVMSDDAWDAFKVPLTPYFLLLDREGGVVGEGSASNMAHLLSLFRQSAADADPTRLGTRGREEFTDDRLRRSGVQPGDRSLYEDPLK